MANNDRWQNTNLGIVMIAVKPQMFPQFLAEVRLNEWFYFGGPEVLCVSIMAGIGLSNLDQQVGTGHQGRI